MNRLVKPDFVPVLAAPMLDPGGERIDMQVPAGATVAEIVTAALPGATEAQLAYCRVTLVAREQMALVPRQNWCLVRPRAGVHVVIRIVPGRGVLRGVLQLVVAVAAAAVGQLWLGPLLSSSLGFASGSVAATLTNSVVTLAASVLGNLLINALIPPVEQDKPKPTYAIAGWRNPYAPGAAVPSILGRHRIAPPFAAGSYTEIVGDLLYVRALFVVSYGPCVISDVKLGDTPIEEYDEVELEIRQGISGEAPVSLYPSQVIEDQQGVELLRDKPRDDYGEVIDGPADLDPVVRYTAGDAAEAAVLVQFPSGLVRFNDEGKKRHLTVDIRIRQRLAGTDTWETVTTLSIRERKAEAFFRQHRWTLPARGRYEIELTRMTEERTSSQESDRCLWVSLQAFRPEYPLNFGVPLTVIAARIRATHQLNGQLDNLNCVAERVMRWWDAGAGQWKTPVWDAGSEVWTEHAATRNPAAAFLQALQGPENAKPVGDDGADLEALGDWYEFCQAKGLKYDRVHDFTGRLDEQLAAIAAAGRASPRHDGKRWTVVIDRPSELVIDHISPRNSRAFRCSRSYFEPPDGFRVPFLDATNDWQSGERIVPWPGYDGEIAVTEELQLPGKTDPAEIWIEARRRQYEVLHRPDRFSAVQDGATRVATRGDLVMASWDILDETQVATRVVAVRDRLIEVDEFVRMEDGQAYACRFIALTDDVPMGESIVRTVVTAPGESRAITVAGDGQMPKRGDLLHFGPAAKESTAVIVRDVEPGEDFAAVMGMVAAAPIIDELTDAEVAPPWNGRVGGEVILPDTPPGIPRFVEIASGVEGTGNTDGLAVLLAPGPGAPVGSYTVEHRLLDDPPPAWAAVEFPGADAGGSIEGYQYGDVAELRARANNRAGSPGDWTNVIQVEIGSKDIILPSALVAPAVDAGLGHAIIAFAVASADTAVSVAIYRQDGTGGTLDRVADLVRELPVSAGTSHQTVEGDATRVNLLQDGGFDTGAPWSFGTGWSHSAGQALKDTPGTESDVDQPVAMTAGVAMRIAFDVVGWAAGGVAPVLSGGSEVAGAIAGADGRHLDRLMAGAGNTHFALRSDNAFDGGVDDAVLYAETAACLGQGEHTFWLEPFNADQQPGPLAGPFTVTII